MNPETNRHVRALLDAHDEAFRALRVANEAMGTAIQAMGTAVQAHDDAISAALTANRAAVDLLEHIARNGQ